MRTDLVISTISQVYAIQQFARVLDRVTVYPTTFSKHVGNQQPRLGSSQLHVQHDWYNYVDALNSEPGTEKGDKQDAVTNASAARISNRFKACSTLRKSAFISLIADLFGGQLSGSMYMATAY